MEITEADICHLFFLSVTILFCQSNSNLILYFRIKSVESYAKGGPAPSSLLLLCLFEITRLACLI